MSNRQVVDSRPSLRTLAYVLRNPELWPEGFTWDYRYCTTCALGMIHQLWGVKGTDEALKRDFGLSFPDALHIFSNARLIERRIRYKIDVTPEQVADLIDEHLAAAQ